MRIFSHIVAADQRNNPVGGSEEQELPVVVNGPLSEVYTQALNHIYAKTDEATGEIVSKPALETQANDHHAIGALVGELNKSPEDFIFEVPQTYVYATRRDLITPGSMDELQCNIDQFEADKGAVQYILVNDTSTPDNMSADFRSIGELINLDRTVEAMESLVLSKGGVVVHSFADIFRKK